MTACCSVLEMEWSSFVPSCRPVGVCGVGRRKRKKKKKRPAVKKGKTDFCAVTKIPEYHHHHISAEQSFVTSWERRLPWQMLEEFWSLVSCAGSKQWGGGLLQSDLRFTRHKPSLVINLHVALRGWEKKKHEAEQNTEPRVSVRHKLHTFRRREFRKKKKEAHALVAGGPVLYLWVLHRAFGLWRQT